MPDLSWFLSLFEKFKSLDQNFSLTLPVSHLPYRSSIRIFDGS
jgi:hypothetical protein